MRIHFYKASVEEIAEAGESYLKRHKPRVVSFLLPEESWANPLIKNDAAASLEKCLGKYAPGNPTTFAMALKVVFHKAQKELGYVCTHRHVSVDPHDYKHSLRRRRHRPLSLRLSKKHLIVSLRPKI